MPSTVEFVEDAPVYRWYPDNSYDARSCKTVVKGTKATYYGLLVLGTARVEIDGECFAVRRSAVGL